MLFGHVYIAQSLAATAEKLIADKFSADMRRIQREMEMKLYQDAWGVTIPQSDDITLSVCPHCEVAHIGLCDPKGLLTD